MEDVLKLYSENKVWIDFVKYWLEFVSYIIVSLGAIKVIFYIYGLRFERKTNNIERDLKIRASLEEKLEKYIIGEHKSGRKDIAIRLVHWKNYPWKLDNDGYPRCLAIDYYHGDLQCGWIDKTGINVQEPVWLFSASIYVEKNGIFFVAPQGNRYNGFQELSDKCLRMHIPFSNIINFDFNKFVEYEPVFYIRCDYRLRKLYDRVWVCREKREEDGWFMLELDSRYQIRKYSFLRYRLSLAGITIDKCIHKCLSEFLRYFELCVGK